jgi:hypothetical protein
MAVVPTLSGDGFTSNELTRLGTYFGRLTDVPDRELIAIRCTGLFEPFAKIAGGPRARATASLSVGKTIFRAPSEWR